MQAQAQAAVHADQSSLLASCTSNPAWNLSIRASTTTLLTDSTTPLGLHHRGSITTRCYLLVVHEILRKAVCKTRHDTGVPNSPHLSISEVLHA